MPSDKLQGTGFQVLVNDLERRDYETTTYAASVALNFADYAPTAQEIVCTGALTLTTTGLKIGAKKTLILTASGAERALTLPDGWKCLGTAPATIASGKIGKFEILSRTAADSGVVYTYAVEA